MAIVKDPGFSSASVTPALAAAKTAYAAAVAAVKAVALTATPKERAALVATQKAAQKVRDTAQDQFDKAKDWEDQQLGEATAAASKAAFTAAGDLVKRRNELDAARVNLKSAKAAFDSDSTNDTKLLAFQSADAKLIAADKAYVAAGGTSTLVVDTPVATPVVADPTAATTQLPPTRQQRGEPAQPTTTPATVLKFGDPGYVLKPGDPGYVAPVPVVSTTGDKKVAPAKVAFGAEYEQRVKTQYPQYAWMLTDLDRTKYSDLFQLLDEATRNPLVPMPDELFDRKFVATSWATELAAGSLGRDVVKTVGNLSWGSGQLGKFLTQAGRFGWTGDNLGFEAYKAIFSKKADGTFENPNAIGEVKASTPFQQLKRIGTDYLSPLDDEQVAASLSGGDTYDDTLRKTRELAKVQYPHLAAAIDAGVTLANISFGYKRQAAEILELDPNTIDMSSAKYNMALKSGEGGKERMMGTGEWAAMLKSDASFGYQFTKQANKDALDLGTTIARAFGKVN